MSRRAIEHVSTAPEECEGLFIRLPQGALKRLEVGQCRLELARVDPLTLLYGRVNYEAPLAERLGAVPPLQCCTDLCTTRCVNRHTCIPERASHACPLSGVLSSRPSLDNDVRFVLAGNRDS